MIAHISGRILKIGPTHTVIDVGGVGYKVFVPVSTLSGIGSIGDVVSLHIFTSVKEDAIELYGFQEELEEQTFELLISVSGVGPKTALGMLSSMTVRDIAASVRDDGRSLQTVPGIGKKTAQRISLEVGEKLQEIALAAFAAEQAGVSSVLGDVVEGLVALGYTRNNARRAAQDAQKKLPGEENAAVVIREALSLLTS